jgi:hypothetical protein
MFGAERRCPADGAASGNLDLKVDVVLPISVLRKSDKKRRGRCGQDAPHPNISLAQRSAGRGHQGRTVTPGSLTAACVEAKTRFVLAKTLLLSDLPVERVDALSVQRALGRQSRLAESGA